MLLSEDALKAFDALKQVCMSAPILAFANYMKEFLLETDASKEGLGAVLSQKQVDGQYHPVTYGSRVLTAYEKNDHSTKLKFLALKWVVTEHFKEYLPYQPFLVKTNNNPLTYIMKHLTSMPLVTDGLELLPGFNFQLKYQKRHDNTVADVLSQITTCLNLDMVRLVLDGITLGSTQRAECQDPTVVEEDHDVKKEVCVAAGRVLVQIHMTDWAEPKREDSVLSTVL